MKVTKSRSFVKSWTYRFFGTLTSFIVVYAITGKGSLATLVAFWETILKVIVYYWHERVWNKIQWGREQDKLVMLLSIKDKLIDFIKYNFICKKVGHNQLNAGSCPFTGVSYNYCSRCNYMIPMEYLD